MLNLVFSVLGFIPLIFGASWLVNGAAAIAKRQNISNLIIGLTIVAFGTSSPELIVNVFSAVSGNTGFSFGNAIGSNIINILIILGISAIIFPVAIKSSTIWIEIPLCLLSALVIFIMANDIFLDGSPSSVLSRTDGILLIAFFVVFMYYSFFSIKKDDSEHEVKIIKYSTKKSILMVVAGMILLAGGGQAIVHFASLFATDYGISERIIGLTIISFGTSLPELTTSIVAAFKKNSDISIGNIIGSNIFNTFLILGVSSTIRPISIDVGANLDLMINILATLLIFIFVFTRKGRKIDHVEGSLLVFIYVAYMVWVFMV